MTCRNGDGLEELGTERWAGGRKARFAKRISGVCSEWRKRGKTSPLQVLCYSAGNETGGFELED